MLRVSAKPRKRNSPRLAEKDAPGFLKFVRGRECLFVGAACYGKIEAAHLDFAGDKGVGTKSSDKFAVPMCAIHHATQHSLGWNTFLFTLGATKDDLLKAASFLWSRWPGRAAWERKLEDGR